MRPASCLSPALPHHPHQCPLPDHVLSAGPACRGGQDRARGLCGGVGTWLQCGSRMSTVRPRGTAGLPALQAGTATKDRGLREDGWDLPAHHEARARGPRARATRLYAHKCTQVHTQARGACAGARAEGEHLSARSCQLGSLPAGPRTLPAPSIYMRPGSARIGQAPGRSGAIAAAPAERVRPRLQPGSPVSSGDPLRGGGITRASRGPPAPAPPPRAQSCPGTRPVLGRPRRPVSAGAGAPVPARPGGPPGTRGQCPAQHTVQSLHCRLKILTALRLPPAPTPDARGDS